jgi:hypothetical protein
MSIWQKIVRSNFVIRLGSWEYWPFGIVQFPSIIYWLWLSLRSRSLVFFSASNPGIVMGGMLGESKYDVLKKIPKQYVPKTILIKLPSTCDEVLEQMDNEGFLLPVILKPEIGEKGFMVKRINTRADIARYLTETRGNFLVQELVNLPLEFGVFYIRFPTQQKGKVTSVVSKEMLSVTGNGRSTLKQLILQKDRAKLQWKKLRKIYQKRLDGILQEGEKLELISIGNHARGTKFLDSRHLINERLSSVFDHISKQIEGFYFGRYDLRCSSLEDLYEGKVSIMELNGCGAEPTHIYDPDFSLHKAVKGLLLHWKNIFEIAKENHKLGIKFISHRGAYNLYRKFKAVTR